jgi:alpha/beta superfamily hydrolase
MDGLPLEPLALSTSDGLSLEAELVTTGDDRPVAAAVICHPHPLYGGSMHNNVVHRLLSDLAARGVPALRFNFRGAGRSEGSHGGGRDEVADVVAAIDGVAARCPGVPVVVAGYSFGADVSLSVDDERIGGWLAVSPPLRIVDPADMAAAADPRPKIIVSGTEDDFRPADAAAGIVAGWANAEVRAAPGVDHFWMTGLDLLDPAAGALLERL